MNRRSFVQVLGAGLAGAALPRWPVLAPERLVERWSWAMGQPVHIMLFADSEDRGLEACARALAELRRVEARLSLFDDASDLCELNRHAGRRPMRVDGDLLAVLRAAARYRAETDGAFDVAVEPVMRAWGFHVPHRAPPTDAEVAEARAAVQAAVVRIDTDAVELPSAHTQLDFGGIAVGYGIDRAAAELRAAGIRRAFIDVSGDCYGLGAPPGEAGWRVAIAGTTTSKYLRDGALATSANTVVPHVMDPQTGRPVPTRRQVTITALTAIAADALSTAALVSTRT
jgi:thiamine biosynthesis lipoprotein